MIILYSIVVEHLNQLRSESTLCTNIVEWLTHEIRRNYIMFVDMSQIRAVDLGNKLFFYWMVWCCFPNILFVIAVNYISMQLSSICLKASYPRNHFHWCFTIHLQER